MAVVGRSKMLDMVDRFIDRLDEHADDAVVGTVMIVLELKHKGPDESTSFHTFSNDGRLWVQRAAMREGMDVLEFTDTLEDNDAAES